MPPAPFGVYVHFPFCVAKCGYCDFSSLACSLEQIPHRRYADAVLAELDARAARYEASALRSIYFGGGTPSLWERAELRRVLEAVRARFGGDDLEVTVEANPGTIDGRGFAELLAAGVTRISLGAQSLDDAMLRLLSRIHDAAAARRAVREARAAGVQSLSLDLIAGLPGQSLAHHLEQLERLLELAPDHVSVYALTLSRHSPLRRAGHAPAPGERVTEMLVAGAERLSRAGQPQYEVSNFAAPAHRSRHNSLCWAGWPYLGLGAAACSMWPDGPRTLRHANPDLPRYLHGGGGTEELVGEAASRLEVLFLGLRTVEGVQRESYRQRFGADPLDHLGARLRALEAAGLVRLLEDRIAPTPRGLWLADALALHLMS
jgi:oxygen-independent coproporphyrinogen III oxidase